MLKLSGESSGVGYTNLMWWLSLMVDFGQVPSLCMTHLREPFTCSSGFGNSHAQQFILFEH